MTASRCVCALAFCLAPLVGRAADLVLLPGDTTLTGPNARQQLIVLARDGGKIVGDRTGQATFASSNPNVAIIENGELRPVGDGDAIITARVGEQTATANVRVAKFKEPATWSF